MSFPPPPPTTPPPLPPPTTTTTRCGNCKRTAFLYLVLSTFVLTVTVVSYKFHLEKLEPLEIFQNRSLTYGVNKEEKALFRDLLQFFDKLTDVANVTYFLYGGTLLGSLRSGDILPWDDDLDLAMGWDSVAKVNSTLAVLKEYGTLLTGSFTFKIWRLDAPKDTGYTWRWPFMDIFLYQSHPNGSIQFMSWGNKTYDSSMIFPLVKRNLMGIQVPSPRRASELLALEYGKSVLEQCKTHYWSHQMEKALYDTAEANCSSLFYLYRFRTEESRRLTRVEWKKRKKKK